MDAVKVNLSTSIGSVNLVKDIESLPKPSAMLEQQRQELVREQAVLVEAGKALKKAADKLHGYHEEVFAAHRDQIVKLSVSIAEKIIRKQIEQGQYDIYRIVTEALSVTPAQQNIVVRLNPEDLEKYLASAKGHEEETSNIELVPDPQIGRGECIVDTEKGIIEYFIDEQLKIVENTLNTGTA